MTVKPLSTTIKCLHMLDVIADQPGPMRISELGRLIGESRATTYQRLLTLTEAGWLDRLPDGSYRLSTRSCRIGAAALDQVGFGDRVQPLLDALARDLGDAISLVVLEGERIVIAQRAEAQAILRADLKVGATLSYLDSSSGGIWLAFGPQDLRHRLEEAGEDLPPQSQIDRVRAQGLSIGGGGETLPDISSLAVPVLDRQGVCRASLSISAPDTRFDAERVVQPLRDSAKRIAEIGGL